MAETPTIQEEAVKTQAEAVPEAPTAAAQSAPVSPAKDLRDIQALVVSGIFPGNMAPAVMRAYQLLDAMAKEVEASAAK